MLQRNLQLLSEVKIMKYERFHLPPGNVVFYWIQCRHLAHACKAWFLFGQSGECCCSIPGVTESQLSSSSPFVQSASPSQTQLLNVRHSPSLHLYVVQSAAVNRIKNNTSVNQQKQHAHSIYKFALFSGLFTFNL